MTIKQFDPETMKKKSEEVSEFLKLLSNPTRLLVLCNLATGERCVSDLEKSVDISQSALSQHLTKMREEGIIEANKQGQKVYYSIVDPNVATILQTLYETFCAPKTNKSSNI